jgi:hypothetical protein
MTISRFRVDQQRRSIAHCVFGRPVNARGESGTRKILKPAISGNASAASADTGANTAAGFSTGHPIDRRRLTFAQSDFSRARRRDRALGI